jgi:2-amino-4-hydroxy-6-hydroxymethyldihydropteridine diphosphokinase
VTSPGPHWWPAYIGIGSNLDSPVQHVQSAIGALGLLPDCFLAARSGLYRSAPLGPVDQPNFINAVAAIMTTLDAPELLSNLQNIENDHGRVRGSEHWGPRTLDLDLLMYGKLIQDDPRLILPHPGIPERNFVLLPFAEIAPDVVIPGLASVAMLASKVDQSRPAIEKLAP